MTTPWEYIGDGIYGRFNGFQFELSGGGPYDTAHVIYVETGAVYEALIAFFKRHLENEEE